jgi:U3 small nucleolar RNA-associated protein 11
MGYLRTMRNQTQKEVEELEEKIQGMGGGTGKKIVFVDDEEDMELRVQEGEWEQEAEEEKESGLSLEEKNLRKLQRREKEKLENKLDVARQRLGALTEAEEALEMQRARMGKSPTVGGVNKNGVKFKVRERKR